MIPIESNAAKKIMAAHLQDADQEYLDFLRDFYYATKMFFGKSTILLPEDPALRKKLETAQRENKL